MAYLTPDTIPNGVKSRALRIPDDPQIWGAVYGALLSLTDDYEWEKLGAVEPTTMAYRMLEMLWEMWDYGEVIVLGEIFAAYRDEVPPHCVECVGQTLARSDYPRLWEVYDPAFRDTSHVFVPDLRDRVIRSSETNGALLGTDQVTLTTDNLPSHNHTSNPHDHATIPHSHSEGIAVSSLASVLPPPDVIPSAVPGIGITSPSGVTVSPNTVTINNTGNGQPFSNIPRSMTIRHFMRVE